MCFTIGADSSPNLFESEFRENPSDAILKKVGYYWYPFFKFSRLEKSGSSNENKLKLSCKWLKISRKL